MLTGCMTSYDRFKSVEKEFPQADIFMVPGASGSFVVKNANEIWYVEVFNLTNLLR